MDKLIEMIEALYDVMHTSQESEMTTYDAGHNDGVADMKKEIISLLRSHPGLWMEEITEEEDAKKEYAVFGMSLAATPATVWYDDKDSMWHYFGTRSTSFKPTKFYRLPQAKEEKK